MRKTSSKTIVALDGMGLNDAREMIAMLKADVWGFKFNDLVLDITLQQLKELAHHTNIMVDLKLYDIPNTINNFIEKIAQHGANIITVHMEPLYIPKDSLQLVMLAGVTVLTSMTNERVANIYLDALPIEEYGRTARSGMVKQFAREAANAGYGFLVCSATDLGAVWLDWANVPPPYRPKLICPGIRMPEQVVKGEDQVQVGTPYNAVLNGADYLVVGRPITQSNHPLEVVQAINVQVARADEDRKTDGGPA